MDDVFNKWNEVKKKTHEEDKLRSFRERDIFYMRIGNNIGFEQNGKGDEFLRPVIVLKKLNRHMFVGVPTSSQIKDGTFFYYFEFMEKVRDNCSLAKDVAVLAQIRVFSSKRLLHKIGVMQKLDFEKMKEKIKELIF